MHDLREIARQLQILKNSPDTSEVKWEAAASALLSITDTAEIGSGAKGHGIGVSATAKYERKAEHGGSSKIESSYTARKEEHLERALPLYRSLLIRLTELYPDPFVILDEAQNTTREQMKMFLTRMGFRSKCVVTGDTSQIDLPREMMSGLVEARRILARVKGIAFTDFTAADVVRHPLVARIVEAYDQSRPAA